MRSMTEFYSRKNFMHAQQQIVFNENNAMELLERILPLVLLHTAWTLTSLLIFILFIITLGLARLRKQERPRIINFYYWLFGLNSACFAFELMDFPGTSLMIGGSQIFIILDCVTSYQSCRTCLFCYFLMCCVANLFRLYLSCFVLIGFQLFTVAKFYMTCYLGVDLR